MQNKIYVSIKDMFMCLYMYTCVYVEKGKEGGERKRDEYMS